MGPHGCCLVARHVRDQASSSLIAMRIKHCQSTFSNEFDFQVSIMYEAAAAQGPRAVRAQSFFRVREWEEGMGFQPCLPTRLPDQRRADFGQLATMLYSDAQQTLWDMQIGHYGRWGRPLLLIPCLTSPSSMHPNIHSMPHGDAERASSICILQSTVRHTLGDIQDSVRAS